MKLHAVDGVLPVPHPHDQTVTPGRHLEAIGKRFTAYDEGVIAGGFELFQGFESTSLVLQYLN